MKLSVIVVSYNTRKLLRKALNHVYASQGINSFEVIVVDNNSHDGSPEMVAREFPQVHLIRNSDNVGFAAGNNPGIEAAKGEYVLLLNSDAFVFDNSLKRTVEYMEANPETGIMGPQLICEDGSPQPSAREFPTPWKKMKVLSGWDSRHSTYESYYDYFKEGPDMHPVPRSVDWVPGTYFMIRREALNDIGLLDERFFMYYEEVDYCLRAKAQGWKVDFNPQISIIHLGGQSSISTQKTVSRTGRQLVDIRVNSEYDFFRKHAGSSGMFLAAGFEVGWKSLIWLKNLLIRGKYSAIKMEESQLAISLVIKKLRKEVSFSFSRA